MKHNVIVAVAVVFLCVTAWAVPSSDVQRLGAVSVDGELAGPKRVVLDVADAPAGYEPPPPPAPTQCEPPQLVEAGADDAGPADAGPLWGPDVTVFDGQLKYITPVQSERMIAYDQTHDGTLFAAFTVQNGETANVYRSTDGGNTWARCYFVYHPGYVLSSHKLVVAEGDSSFVFFFFKSSAANGDIHVARMYPTGAGAGIFSVKADADTVVNLSACCDREDHYYLHVAFETREGNYSMRQLRSTDYGKTWAETGGYVLNDRTSPKPDICFGNGDNVYIVLRYRASSTDSAQLRLKQSTNRGGSWLLSQQISNLVVPVYDPVIGAKHTDSTVWVVHTRDLSSNGTGDAVCYYYSTDNGANWTNGSFIGPNSDADEQMPSIACNLTSGTPTVSYSVAPGESIMFTWCQGDTNWTEPERVSDNRSTGFFPSQAGWMSAGGNWSCVLYAGYTALGLYFDGFDMTGMEESRPVAEKPAVLAARPNPAFDQTVVSYNLPVAGPIRVAVLDVAGREVEVLEQGALAAGTHSAVWDCRRVPAGVYLIRVDNGTSSQTGRLVVSH
jgi:hypothetical protein